MWSVHTRGSVIMGDILASCLLGPLGAPGGSLFLTLQ